MSGKLAVILFGLVPIGFLLWAIGIDIDGIALMFVIAVFAIIFFMHNDNSDKTK